MKLINYIKHPFFIVSVITVFIVSLLINPLQAKKEKMLMKAKKEMKSEQRMEKTGKEPREMKEMKQMRKEKKEKKAEMTEEEKEAKKAQMKEKAKKKYGKISDNKLKKMVKEDNKYTKRMARIQKLEEIAKKNGNTKLLKKAQQLRNIETGRHQKKVEMINKEKETEQGNVTEKETTEEGGTE